MTLRRLSGEKLAAERERLEAMRFFEHRYAPRYQAICGIDEAGRGPLAGPVAAGAVILPPDCEILFLNDSKKLSPKRRELLYDEIREKAVAWAVGIVGPEEIDSVNILQADYEAMRQAIAKLGVKPDLLLNDAVTIPGVPIRQVPIIKGDAKSVSIAAASILAKVTRDRIMEQYDRQYPEYGFAKHKGYGTAAHIAALKKYGPCPIHRRSFIGHFIPEEGGCGTGGAAGTDTGNGTGKAAGNDSPAGAGTFGGGTIGDGTAPGRPLSTRARGALEERKAESYLEAQGVEILARNYRTRTAEIDLIGRDGGFLVFFEVKYRRNSDMGMPLEAVDRRKQEKILDAARRYLYENRCAPDQPVRFDCIGILGDAVTWEKNAFWEK